MNQSWIQNLRTAYILLAVSVVFSLSFLVFAFFQKAEADRQREVAEEQRMVAEQYRDLLEKAKHGLDTCKGK